MSDWIASCLESALFALAFVAIFEGTRRLVAGDASRWVAVVLAVALLAPAYEGASSLRVSKQLQVLVRAPGAMQVSEPAGGWEKAVLSPADRTKASTTAAQLNFRVTGKRGDWIDADGKRVAFQPDDQDLADRDSLVRNQKGTEDLALQFADRAIRLFSSAATALLLGGLAGGLRRRRGRSTASPAR